MVTSLISDGDDNDERGCPCSRQDKHRRRHRSPPGDDDDSGDGVDDDSGDGVDDDSGDSDDGVDDDIGDGGDDGSGDGVDDGSENGDNGDGDDCGNSDESEGILGYVTTVTSFQVNVDNQRRDHRWVESAFCCGNDYLAVRIVATSPNARVPWRRRRWGRSSTSVHSVTSKTGPIIWKKVRSYSLMCLLILIQAFIRKCTPALAVDPIFRWFGVEALIGGGARVWVTRAVSWMR